MDALNAGLMHAMASCSSNSDVTHVTYVTLLGSLLSLFISLLIILFVGEYLFNNILVKVVPCINPVNSIWQLFGLILIIRMII